MGVFLAAAYACGIVVLKMSSMQLHVLSQVSGENFSPLRMTTFSRQFVPERASCSLSAEEEETVNWRGEMFPYIAIPKGLTVQLNYLTLTERGFSLVRPT